MEPWSQPWARSSSPAESGRATCLSLPSPHWMSIMSSSENDPNSAAERNSQAAKSTRLPDGRPPRRSGDGWTYGADGKKHWGLNGAAGLMLVDPERGVLMQHRALWSVEGGTWGFPGGARDMGESAVEAAIRESWEE